MASIGTSQAASKATVVMTLDDILSDLDKMPRQVDNSSSSASSSSSSRPFTRLPLPESSETVETSIELSQRFIDSSKRVLQDTDALDAVRADLDRVDRLLDEVEQGVRT